MSGSTLWSAFFSSLKRRLFIFRPYLLYPYLFVLENRNGRLHWFVLGRLTDTARGGTFFLQLLPSSGTVCFSNNRSPFLLFPALVFVEKHAVRRRKKCRCNQRNIFFGLGQLLCRSDLFRVRPDCAFFC